MKSIWMKLALAFMAVSASGILISTILSIKEMDLHFFYYISDVHRKHQADLLAMLREEYQQGHEWNERTFLKLDTASQLLKLKITVYDQEKQLIRTFGNTTTAHTKLQDDMIPVLVRGTPIGYLGIEHDNTDSISLEEHFQTAHTNALQWTMLALLVIVCTISIFIAKWMSRPIVNMSRAALAVTKGDLSVRVPLPKGKDELYDLVQTFNNLVHNLQKQEELRKRLTSDIAHELRTPLNTLLAQTEGMIDGIWKATPEHLEAARSEVVRLIRIVSDLDQVIQAEAGALSISLDVINLNQVVENIADSMNPSFQQKGIRLTVRLDNDVWILGDKQRLAQVFSNLLTNALKHTPESGEVIISVVKKERKVEVKVIDNGAGISPEDLPYVFERFYRGDRSRNREKGGTGLGLTIVKGIVEAHQGEISIESEVGKGTTVTITLPASESFS
ncbi:MULTISPECIES: ATP-binding protein [Bacillales]|jgi:two-component system, OmpR family, sensor histidine kinase BaeS|uniref:HAMP domain-containing sensor histidine kinase n=1 Tax=Brevibacillus TaxID=55080 RepID=UPI000E379884|nr:MULTISPECIES: ATP-binding protein [Bacillales]MDT3418220.1 signal transduction histidine kinase [Brevibacillus aydinogluensis]NNV04046.1 HAMP domain-containing histidine kinase [Brevibacillus sp. MCWH]REK68252.1 MAG: sensor histidine kinase [Brevibacillus sp.]UFJ60956.1 HAMP domain-containing histidine kinase [Anoxybacillus sediminis]